MVDVPAPDSADHERRHHRGCGDRPPRAVAAIELVEVEAPRHRLGGQRAEARTNGVGLRAPLRDAAASSDLLGVVRLRVEGPAELVVCGLEHRHVLVHGPVGEARDGSGPELEKVQAGSPAADAGLKVGDIITKVADRSVSDVDSLLAAVRDHQPGDQVTITLLRGGDEQTVTVTMGSKEG